MSGKEPANFSTNHAYLHHIKFFDALIFQVNQKTWRRLMGQKLGIWIHFFYKYNFLLLSITDFINSTIYNVIWWFAGTNDSSTKHYFFFYNFLQNSLQKVFLFIYLFIYLFFQIRVKISKWFLVLILAIKYWPTKMVK